MRKEQQKQLILIGFIFICVLSTFFARPIGNLDELWNYNFARNITEGLVPYRDISMITTPLLPMINSLFLNLWNEVWMMRLLATVLITGILFFIYKISTKIIQEENVSLFLTGSLAILLKNGFAMDYNLAVLFLTLILLSLELRDIQDDQQRKKIRFTLKKEMVIGILAGCAILTKQSTGGILAMVTVLYPAFWVREKQEIKEYGKIAFFRVIGILIPIFVFILYLIVTNSLSDFLSYGVFAIKTFTNSIPYTRLWEEEGFWIPMLAKSLPISLIALSFLGIFAQKEKTETKNLITLLFYSLPMLLTMYPIADKIHFSIGSIMLILTTCYTIFFLSKRLYQKINYHKKKKVITYLTFLAWLVLFSFILIQVLQNFNQGRKLEGTKQIHHYQNIVVEPYLQERIEVIGSFIISQKEQGNHVVILDAEAAVYQIPLDQYQKNYDMFLKGNLGKEGEEGQIEKIKKEKDNRIFLIRKPKLASNWQTPTQVIDYVRQNLKKTGEVSIYEIYQK